MATAYLVKYAEIGIKGKNRYKFEDALVRRVINRVQRVDGKFRVTKEQGRILVEALSEHDEDEVLHRHADARAHQVQPEARNLRQLLPPGGKKPGGSRKGRRGAQQQPEKGLHHKTKHPHDRNTHFCCTR